jgi:hypothetical protein
VLLLDPLVPTDNLARFRTASASSEEPGLYAEAAVDGNDATVWAPTATTATLTADLGARAHVKRIVTRWTDTAPAAHRVFTSTDSRSWTAAPPLDASGTLARPVQARYVRVEITHAGTERVGIRELEVLGTR